MANQQKKSVIGVIGGSSVYDIEGLTNKRWERVNSLFGEASDEVVEVFRVLGRRSMLVPVPLWSARLALSLVRLHPRYRHWSVARLERMGQNLVFDHTPATRDFAFQPRRFVLTPEGVPT